MTDRELLELAAKAAQVAITEWHPDLNMAMGAFFLEDGNCWNPLTDDGDAFHPPCYRPCCC